MVNNFETDYRSKLTLSKVCLGRWTTLVAMRWACSYPTACKKKSNSTSWRLRVAIHEQKLCRILPLCASFKCQQGYKLKEESHGCTRKPGNKPAHVDLNYNKHIIWERKTYYPEQWRSIDECVINDKQNRLSAGKSKWHLKCELIKLV